MDSLASRALAARKFAKLTQAQAAEASGVKQSDISKIERGASARSTGLLSLARVYKVNPYWLDTGEGNMEMADTSLSAAGVTPFSGSANLTVIQPPTAEPSDVGLVLETIARAMAKADKIDRSSLIHLFSLMGDDAAENVLIAQRMANLLAQPASTPEQTEDQDKKGKGRRIVHQPHGDNNEQRGSAEEQEDQRGIRGIP